MHLHSDTSACQSSLCSNLLSLCIKHNTRREGYEHPKTISKINLQDVFAEDHVVAFHQGRGGSYETAVGHEILSHDDHVLGADDDARYPEKLADSSFDNTGLLLEAPHRPGHLNNSALLTIDLTKAVADEAIARKDSIIISYHPIIFRGLKSLTLDNTQQTSLLRLAQEGISVYSPHTALDAAPDGLNSWLVSVVIGKFSPETCIVRYNSKTIHPIKDLSTLPEQFSEAGYGQIVTFSSSQSLGSIIRRIMKALDVRNLSVAVPQNVPRGNRSSIRIKSIGICAGSGGSMLNGLDVDLLFTGELSHHEALAAIEAGRCVITAFHSNSERGFLKHMKQDLENAVAKELNQPADLEDNDAKRFNIDISKIDSDPFDMITDIDKF